MEKPLHTQIHTCLYFEILRGKFRPDKIKCNKNGEFKDLYLEANMVKVPVTDSAKDHEAEIDYNAYGYKSSEHYEFIHKRNFATGRKDVYIRPTKRYVPRELPALYPFSSKKADGYRELIADEFERIRIRAEKVYDNTTDDRLLILYALRNIQKVMLLFDDSLAIISERLKMGNFEDAYIYYVLAVYLIKCVSLYNHYFSMHLKNDFGNEDAMKKSLDSVLAQGCFVINKNAELTDQCEDEKKSLPDISVIQKGVLLKSPSDVNSKKSLADFSGTLAGETANSMEESQVENDPDKKRLEKADHSPSPKYCWNMQINVLIDLCLQISEKIRHKGEPAITMTREELKDFLIRNFLDKNGNELSHYTLDTLLKPYRIDKFLNPDSPKRIFLDIRES